MIRVEATDARVTVDCLDDVALVVLEGFISRPRDEANAALQAWLDAIAVRLEHGTAVGVIEYLVVLAVHRREPLIASATLPRDVDALARMLTIMRRRLLGESIDPAVVHRARLPRAFLARQRTEAQALHAAIFRRLDGRASSALVNFYVGYTPRTHDPIVALAMVALCMSSVGTQLVLGGLFGYLFGTVIEHAIHKHVGHASRLWLRELERRLSRFGWPGRLVHRGASAIAFRHGTIHHASYAVSYVEPFAAVDGRMTTAGDVDARTGRKRRIDGMAIARGAREAADIFASGYGTSLAHPANDAWWVIVFAAALTWALAAAVNALGGSLTVMFVIASVAASLLFLWFSHWIHPYLHMPRHVALAAAGPLMRPLLRSRYVSHIARAHYLHHRDASVNQNLAIGADFVLGYRMSSIESILRLRSMHAFY